MKDRGWIFGISWNLKMRPKYNNMSYNLALNSTLLYFYKYFLLWTQTKLFVWAVVVAQLVEWFPPIPEIHSSNPVIVKNLYWTFVYCRLNWKDENKEKGSWKWPIFKTFSQICQSRSRQSTSEIIFLSGTKLCKRAIWKFENPIWIDRSSATWQVGLKRN